MMVVMIIIVIVINKNISVIQYRSYTYKQWVIKTGSENEEQRHLIGPCMKGRKKEQQAIWGTSEQTAVQCLVMIRLLTLAGIIFLFHLKISVWILRTFFC